MQKALIAVSGKPLTTGICHTDIYIMNARVAKFLRPNLDFERVVLYFCKALLSWTYTREQYKHERSCERHIC